MPTSRRADSDRTTKQPEKGNTYFLQKYLSQTLASHTALYFKMKHYENFYIVT